MRQHLGGRAGDLAGWFVCPKQLFGNYLIICISEVQTLSKVLYFMILRLSLK